jgi:hypothetical protein
MICATKAIMSVEGEDRLFRVLPASLLDDGIPLLADREFRVVLAGDDVVLVERL